MFRTAAFVGPILGLFLASSLAHAIDLSEETQYASDQFQQTASIFGDFGEGKTEDDAPFSLGFNGSYLKTTTETSGVSIVDETTSYGLSLSWIGDNHLSLDGKLSYGSTPAENLKVTGGQIGVGYKWVYGDPAVSKAYPSLGFRLIGQQSNYVATYSGSVARNKKVTRVVSGSSELQQRMLGANVKWRWAKTWRANVEYDNYSYNRDVASFVNTLDSARAVETGQAGFGTVVGGMPKDTVTLGLSWDFVRDWTLSASNSRSRLVTDNSVSQISRVGIGWQVTEPLEINIGWIAQRSDTANDDLVFLGLDYAP